MTDPANKSAGSPPTGDQPHVASAPEPRRITEFDADQPQHAAAPVGFAALLGVLGVVYGDIGTSPLYAFRSTVEVISGHHQVAPWEILGVASLIFWTLILIVTVKYVILIMRRTIMVRAVSLPLCPSPNAWLSTKEPDGY